MVCGRLMASWADFKAAEPDLADRVEERFAIRKHKTLATLREDGSPRISGIEVEFSDGELYLGMMPASRKLHDLRRDPRLALHSPTDDPPPDRPAGWRGEAKISGNAVEVDAPTSRVAGASRVRVEIREVVLTHLNDAGDQLVVEAWHAGRGRQRLERR
jgi:nitroimidazol reductase NimA-like FMN-containing flavoprotein (pyridoxamine 5'-phosphate oxidase superfamily)